MKKILVTILLNIFTISCTGTPQPKNNSDCQTAFEKNVLTNGDVDSKLALGFNFYEQKICLSETKQIFESAIAMDSHEAAVALGDIFFEEKDYTRAAFNYLKAELLGSKIGGPYMLGIMNEEGFGTEKNYDKAYEYYEIAANEGDSLAQLRIADLLYEKK